MELLTGLSGEERMEKDGRGEKLSIRMVPWDHQLLDQHVKIL